MQILYIDIRDFMELGVVLVSSGVQSMFNLYICYIIGSMKNMGELEIKLKCMYLNSLWFIFKISID